MKSIDLTGKVFKRLTVVKQVEKKKAQLCWECLCICGGITVTTSNSLLTGKTTSCGCKQKEVSLENIKIHVFNKTHGMTLSRVYRRWSGMHDRCKQTNETHRSRYFDRGIRVCDRWSTFENFYLDMGDIPEGKTLDRIDNDGPYAPENCRWASLKEQQRNQRQTNFLLIGGKKIPAMNIADSIGVKKAAMQYFVTVSRKLMEKYGYIPTP